MYSYKVAVCFYLIRHIPNTVTRHDGLAEVDSAYEVGALPVKALLIKVKNEEYRDSSAIRPLPLYLIRPRSPPPPPLLGVDVAVVVVALVVVPVCELPPDLSVLPDVVVVAPLKDS
jgi:hypothetical protein